MKTKKKAAAGWAAAGAVLSLCVLIAVIYGLNRDPQFLADPSKVTAAAEEVLDCACTGDLDTLEKMLYCEPSLGDVPNRDTSVQSMIWYAYLDSIRYSLPDTPEVTDEGISLNVSITCLDISAITEALKDTAPDLMAQEAAAAGSDEEIYDADHNYRESFISEVLQKAVSQILRRQPQTMEREITLQLVRSDRQWQVVPNEELLQLLSGFVSE